MTEIQLDEIGVWSEMKLKIIQEYAKPCSAIMAAQKLHHLYIDGFAGAGMHVSKESGAPITGSPLRVAEVTPPFREYHLVELNPAKAAHLRALLGTKPDFHIHEGDCNALLPSTLIPLVRYGEYKRAFCLLDPYGLQLDWQVIAAAGKQGTIDLLLNFPIMDMNRNVLWRERDKVEPEQLERMNRFWGDESWKAAAYQKTQGLFGEETQKQGNSAIVKAFKDRLRQVAGFAKVSAPLAMRNSTNADVYYLFFASQNGTAAKIMGAIFAKYRALGGQ